MRARRRAPPMTPSPSLAARRPRPAPPPCAHPRQIRSRIALVSPSAPQRPRASAERGGRSFLLFFRRSDRFAGHVKKKTRERGSAAAWPSLAHIGGAARRRRGGHGGVPRERRLRLRPARRREGAPRGGGPRVPGDRPGGGRVLRRGGGGGARGGGAAAGARRARVRHGRRRVHGRQQAPRRDGRPRARRGRRGRGEEHQRRERALPGANAHLARRGRGVRRRLPGHWGGSSVPRQRWGRLGRCVLLARARRTVLRRADPRPSGSSPRKLPNATQPRSKASSRRAPAVRAARRPSDPRGPWRRAARRSRRPAARPLRAWQRTHRATAEATTVDE